MAAYATRYASGNVLKSGAQMTPSGDTASTPAVAVKVGTTTPRFLAFLAAQFLGAANDNAFKITLILFVLSAVSGEARQVRYSSLATALYPIRFCFSRRWQDTSPTASQSIAYCSGRRRPRSSR